MKFVYEFDNPVGQRFCRYGFGVTIMDDLEPYLWWDDEKREWIDTDEMRKRIRVGQAIGSCAPCRTFKAFKRHLRKHYHMLKGRTVYWPGRYDRVKVQL